jgi:hypothetical protein
MGFSQLSFGTLVLEIAGYANRMMQMVPASRL